MNSTKVINCKFHPGIIAITSGAKDKLDPEYTFGALTRHLVGDWGLVNSEDWDTNDRALKSKRGRLLSVYPLPNEAGDFWVITEADHRVTTILLPEEY